MNRWLFLFLLLGACENPGPVRRGYVISETHPESPAEAITAWETVGEEPPPAP